jgi:hypothetical protein
MIIHYSIHSTKVNKGEISAVAQVCATALLFSRGGEGRSGMDKNHSDEALRQRIRSGKVTREDVARRLAELAFGKANDCVRLVLEEDAKMGRLDLSLLSEVKRSDKGAVEIRLIDRLRALEQLAQLASEDGNDLESFLQALQGGKAE